MSHKRRRSLAPFAFCVLVFILAAAFCALPAYAHPGRTDANGGHWDHSSGEYHYHHGYPAHQHPGGVCPYGSTSTPTPRPASAQSTVDAFWNYRDSAFSAFNSRTEDITVAPSPSSSPRPSPSASPVLPSKPTQSSKSAKPQLVSDGSLVRSVLIASPFVFMSSVISILIGVSARKRRKQYEAKQLELVEAQKQEIESLKSSHSTEVRRLNESFSLRFESQRSLYQQQIDRLKAENAAEVHINWKSPASVINVSQHNSEIAALNAEHKQALESLRASYEKRIEDLRTIQQIRFESALKSRDSEHAEKMKKSKEKEERLAIIIWELIEASCDCEFPVDTPPGSSSPVPCVYVTKDKVWHIKRHRTVASAQTMALHDALLKGYAGCTLCVKKLPPFFHF